MLFRQRFNAFSFIKNMVKELNYSNSSGSRTQSREIKFSQKIILNDIQNDTGENK